MKKNLLNKSIELLIKLILPASVIFFLAFALKGDLTTVSETWGAFLKSLFFYLALLISVFCLIVIQRTFHKTYIIVIIVFIALLIFLFAYEPAFSPKLLSHL